MACVARMFGGLRTDDLHAVRWESFDTDGGRFERGWAPRKKTASQLLEVPEMLPPILGDWWERHGRPASGLVFPVLRGERAGQEKRGVSHARAMRRDLRRVLGIDVWDPDAARWRVAVREMTARECELLEGSEYRKPVDFHSWRRAYNQALGDAGVNAQTAQALAGHSSLEAHARYLRNTTRARAIPASALPHLDVRASSLPKRITSPSFSQRAPEDSNLRPADSKSDAPRVQLHQ